MLRKIQKARVDFPVIFCAVLTLMCLHLPMFAHSQEPKYEEPKYEMLSDKVEHWYHVNKDKKPWFFKHIENIYNAAMDEPPFGKSVAFLVGVSKYEYISPQLPFVKNDLKAMREFLLTSGGFDEVYVAMDNVVTDKLVKNYMFNKFKESSILGVRDRLLFYYSGHAIDMGGNHGYMQFSKAKSDQYVVDQMLAIKDYMEWSKILPARHVLFLFDCCASGLGITSKLGTDSKQKIIQTLSCNGSRTVITAGTAKQSTYSAGNYSIFTRAFIDALKSPQNINGFMTTSEIFAQIELRVTDFAIQNNIDLSPRLQNLMLIIIREHFYL